MQVRTVALICGLGSLCVLLLQPAAATAQDIVYDPAKIGGTVGTVAVYLAEFEQVVDFAINTELVGVELEDIYAALAGKKFDSLVTTTQQTIDADSVTLQVTPSPTSNAQALSDQQAMAQQVQVNAVNTGNQASGITTTQGESLGLVALQAALDQVSQNSVDPNHDSNVASVVASGGAPSAITDGNGNSVLPEGPNTIRAMAEIATEGSLQKAIIANTLLQTRAVRMREEAALALQLQSESQASLANQIVDRR